MQTAAKFGLIALIALVLVVLPGGGAALNVTLTLLSITFFTLIALLGYRMFRQFRPELDTLEDRTRLVLYSSIGLAFVALCATGRLFDSGGLGVLAWLALLGMCSYGIYWTWIQYRGEYD